MFLSPLIEELCTKEENDKTGCKLNFGHECTLNSSYEICNKIRHNFKTYIITVSCSSGRSLLYLFFCQPT